MLVIGAETNGASIHHTSMPEHLLKIMLTKYSTERTGREKVCTPQNCLAAKYLIYAFLQKATVNLRKGMGYQRPT